MDCPKCGRKNSDSATICASCYFDLHSDKTPVRPAERTGPRPVRPTVTAGSAPAAPYQPSGQPSPPPPPTVYGAPPATQHYPPQAYAPAAIMDYVGFWGRFAATFLDGIIFAIVGVAVYAALGTSMIPEMTTGANGMPTPVVDPNASTAQMILSAIGLVYTISLNTAYGATLGKMALGMKIVKSDGSPISVGTAILRYVAESILAAVTIGITFIAVAFTARKQGFHDMVADTVVIKTR